MNTATQKICAIVARLNAQAARNCFDFSTAELEFYPCPGMSDRHFAVRVDGRTKTQAESRAANLSYTLEQAYECHTVEIKVQQDEDAQWGWEAYVWFRSPVVDAT